MRKTDTCGLDLGGAIDGVNRNFRTSLPMQMDAVDCLINGRLKVASLDDGYEVTDDRTVTLKEAPLPGDTVQVSYATGSSPGGQAGGVPPGPEVINLGPPSLEVCQLAPPSVSVRPTGCGCA